MSEEPSDVGSIVDFPEQTKFASTNSSPLENSEENNTGDVKSPPGCTASGASKKSPEKDEQSPGSSTENIQVGEVTWEASELVENDEELSDVKESSEKEEDNIREAQESLEDVKKKAKDDFVAATEHILSSPSDLCEVVSSFENLQPIYGSEALNFRSDDENIAPPKDISNKVDDSEIKNKSDRDKETEKSLEKGKSDGKKNISSKTGATDWEIKRDRRKSSVLTDADLTRKSSEDQYPIGIPLRKKVNKSTRKKLWREIQKRKPFISATVSAHIHYFAKPPFQTWGCHNSNYRKDVKSYISENWK